MTIRKVLNSFDWPKEFCKPGLVCMLTFLRDFKAYGFQVISSVRGLAGNEVYQLKFLMKTSYTLRFYALNQRQCQKWNK